MPIKYNHYVSIKFGLYLPSIYTTYFIDILYDYAVVSIPFIKCFSQSEIGICGGKAIYFFIRSSKWSNLSVFYQGSILNKIL